MVEVATELLEGETLAQRLEVGDADEDELYAAMWEFERKAWGPKTAGPDSGLWKTADGGKTWTEFTYAEGLPEGIRMQTNLVDCDPDEVEIGMQVDVVFRDVTDEVTLPYFTPVKD